MPNEILEQQDTDRQTAGLTPEQSRMVLFSQPDMERFRGDWNEIQASFVDEPRQAVQRADQLVDSMIQRLTESFAGERGKLEQGWSRGPGVSTEDLRQALRRYRSFFDRLLAA